MGSRNLWYLYFIVTGVYYSSMVFELQVLLPLVNAPMIDYTLAWLESAGVEEVFVFCSAHSKQVVDYLDNSNWFGQPNFSVTTIESHNAISAGDALRSIYEQHVVCNDICVSSCHPPLKLKTLLIDLTVYRTS